MFCNLGINTLTLWNTFNKCIYYIVFGLDFDFRTKDLNAIFCSLKYFLILKLRLCTDSELCVVVGVVVCKTVSVFSFGPNQALDL